MKVELKVTAAAKLQAAPIAIMPSTPRLSTPERSATSSPERRDQQRRRRGDDGEQDGFESGHLPPPRVDETNAVADERVGGQNAEQQDALESLGEIERQLQQDLRALAADEGERHDEGRDQDADGVEPAEERHGDGREAVAGRDRRLQLADLPRNLRDAGKPREPARDREDRQRRRFGAEAGKPRGPRRVAA